LDRLKSEVPAIFERVVIALLVKMGYGGSRADAAQAIGKSGDEGLDGIIKEDRLGLDIIYVQAKRWETTVGRPEIQKFAGALHGQHATKGIFITTSEFSRDAPPKAGNCHRMRCSNPGRGLHQDRTGSGAILSHASKVVTPGHHGSNEGTGRNVMAMSGRISSGGPFAPFLFLFPDFEIRPLAF